jgi:hypothetical protein
MLRLPELMCRNGVSLDCLLLAVLPFRRCGGAPLVIMLEEFVVADAAGSSHGWRRRGGLVQ